MKIPEMPIEVACVLGHLILAESDSAALTLEVVRPVQLFKDALLPLLEGVMMGGQHNGADGNHGGLQFGRVFDDRLRNKFWRRLDLDRSCFRESRDSATCTTEVQTETGPVKLLQRLEESVDIFGWLHRCGSRRSQGGWRGRGHVDGGGLGCVGVVTGASGGHLLPGGGEQGHQGVEGILLAEPHPVLGALVLWGVWGHRVSVQVGGHGAPGLSH